MTSQTHMFNPNDAAVLAAFWSGSFFLGLIASGSPVVAAVASAIVIGIFGLIAKSLELYVKSKADKRLARMQQENEELRRRLAGKEPAEF